MGLRLNIRVYTQEGSAGDEAEHGYEINVTKRKRELTDEQGLAFGAFMANIASQATSFYFGDIPLPSGEAGYQSKCCHMAPGEPYECDHGKPCNMKVAVGLICATHE